jgi:hypothetical protein
MSVFIKSFNEFNVKCRECQFHLSIFNSPIKELKGVTLENFNIVSLKISNMENLNDIDMKIFPTTKLRDFRITDGSCLKCGKNIIKDLKLFSNLEQVWLGNMEIGVVPEGTFNQNLKTINIANTRIDLLDNYAFKSPNYDYSGESFSITLKNCSLSDSSIAEKAFANIDRNVELSMEENYLTKLDEKTFRPLLEKNSGSKISLKGNSLTCDYLMQWTLEPGKNYKIQLSDASCDDGRPLSKHSYEELANNRSTFTTTDYNQTTTLQPEVSLSPGAIAAITTASVVTVGIGGLICCKFTCPAFCKTTVLPLCCCCRKFSLVKCFNKNNNMDCMKCFNKNTNANQVSGTRNNINIKNSDQTVVDNTNNETTDVTGVGGRGNIVNAENWDQTGVNNTNGIPSSS